MNHYSGYVFIFAFMLVVVSGRTFADETVSENLLRNGSFAEGENLQGIPLGWSRYGGGSGHRLAVEERGESRVLVLKDGDRNTEIGLVQTLSIEAGLTYEASVDVRAVESASALGAHLQLRFLPSQKYVQTSLTPASNEEFETISVKGTAPPGTKRASVYVYSHREPTPELSVRRVQLISGVTPPPPPPPPPVPPVYTELKNLHLTTPIVTGGKPRVTLLVPASGLYDEQAERIQQSVKRLTGVQLPIENDESPAGTVPIRGHLVVLGNRSTNKTISELYNRYYTLLDLRYPGAAGCVVRSLHNPFGDGRNLILVGGSDLPGVDAASNEFIEQLRGADAAEGELSVSRIERIQLGRDIHIPRNVREMETWEASKGYGSIGYFGWTSISKQMAMYYMTGNEYHAREFLRLAFPDEQGKREIAEIDGERIENKDDPLAGPYHYNAHMMILFWDLIEESPVFTDEQRLRVTNAFARQLNHRKGEGIYGRTSPPAAVGSRHGQWSAVSLYCLGRYFQKDYPHPIWYHSVEGARLHFRPLHEHAWVGGESDNLFWYNTGIAPIFSYLLLSGERKPLENGVLAALLRGQEMLISGRQPDWALNSASLGYLHKAAYLTGDARYIEYRQRTNVDTQMFRLGQSFWPEEHLRPKLPEDLAGRWSIHELPKPMWRARGSGISFQESFQFASFRSAADAGGDFILIDGFNGASRNPYHTFAILELRLNGCTLLRGYRNQLLTRADGMVEPRIPMDAALQFSEVLGATAAVTGEVAQAAYSRWRRTLVQRVNRYALVVDQLTFRTDAENMEVQIPWETDHAAKVFADGHLEFDADIETPTRRRVSGAQIWPSRPVNVLRRGRVATMQWLGTAKAGERKAFFSLLGMRPDAEPTLVPSHVSNDMYGLGATAGLSSSAGSTGGQATPGTRQTGLDGPLGCYQRTDNAAALALPAPALAVVGNHQGVRAEFAIVANDHLYGIGCHQIPNFADAERPPTASSDRTAVEAPSALLHADTAISVDWDFHSGMLHVIAPRSTQLTLSSAAGQPIRFDGQPLQGATGGTERITLRLSAGKHILEGIKPSLPDQEKLSRWLADELEQGRAESEQTQIEQSNAKPPTAPPLEPLMSSQVDGAIVDLAAVAEEAGIIIYAAAGTTVQRLTMHGKTLPPLQADGAIRSIRWWPEYELLLAGCVDEQVIAFDRHGKRRWVFVSEMDPAVFRAAKTYWFKSAPGHEGIHGLHTGTFLDGKSQAFVGSACTLEILDEQGRLVRRLPQFWGKVSHFAIIEGPDGSLNLLTSRKYNGTNRVGIINNRTLDPAPRGFNSVPSGCTYVPGWSSMNRYHLFYEDLDGDGTKEVVSETNGTWNRVTVWRADGHALYDASFGPGERIPSRNMRDLDLCDLDLNGRKEILAATSSGLIVALDHRCRKVWATRLANPAVVMESEPLPGGRGAWIVVGCEDGRVVVLDGKGRLVQAGSLRGRPTCIESVNSGPFGRLVVLATDKGQVAAYRIAE